MEYHGFHQSFGADQDAQFLPQTPIVPRTPTHGRLPAFTPGSGQYAVPQPMNMPAGFQFSPQQMGTMPVMSQNGAMPAGMVPIWRLQPGPMAPFPQQPLPVVHDELFFDPNTPPPFADSAKLRLPRRNGVLKIDNIPYTISIPEMNQFICKYIPNDHLITPHTEGYPIHIIMERSTGKTMDAYIEVKSPTLAANDYSNYFEPTNMRLPKIGQRNVDVHLSSHAELMRDLFPRAKCCHWTDENNIGLKLLACRDTYSSGFNGFVTSEEVTCMVRHAEYPQRSQFALRSMNRTFECMVSTAYKFPWYATNLYTMRQSQDLFNAFKRQLDILVLKVNDPNISREVGLDNKLLFDLTCAGMNVPAFSERQRAIIRDSVPSIGPGWTMSQHAYSWPFQTLSASPLTTNDQDIAHWLNLLHAGIAAKRSKYPNMPTIGIDPYLLVTTDEHGQVIFQPTEAGLDLKRAQFSLLETRMLNELLRYGWAAWLRDQGIDPPAPLRSAVTHAMRNSLEELEGHSPPIADTDNGAYTVNEDGHYRVLSNGVTVYDFEKDTEFIQAGATGVDEDSHNDPEQALEAMREVVNTVRQAPPPADRDQANRSMQNAFNREVQGLGAGLNNMALNNAGNVTGVARYVPPARRGGGQDMPQAGAHFNPELPVFERSRARNPPFTTASRFPTVTAFGGVGLGNGDFTTSPGRTDAGRGSNLRHSINNDGVRESALTAPAASVRLHAAPPMCPVDPALRVHGNGPAQVLTYGEQLLAQAGQIQTVETTQPQEVVAHAANDGETVTALQPAATIVPGQVAAAGRNNPLYRARTRPSNGMSPNHGTDGTTRTFDDTLGLRLASVTDDLTQLTRAAEANMRTASEGTLAPPSTPPSNHATPLLRRSPAREGLREHLRADYDFDETLYAGGADDTPVGVPADDTTTTATRASTPAMSAPTTPAQNRLLGIRRIRPASVNTSPEYNQALNETSGGEHLPLTPGMPLSARNTATFGAIGDGSPVSRIPTRAANTAHPRTDLPEIYTRTEVTAEMRARRLMMQQSMRRREQAGDYDE